MRVRTGALMTLVLALATAGAVMLTAQNYRLAAHRPPAEESAEAPRYILRDAQWTRLNAQGEPDYVADAKQIDYFDDRSAHLQLPRIHAFGGTQSPWLVTAPEGRTLPHSRNLALTGGVIAEGHWPDGEQLRIDTDFLWVDQGLHVLRTDAPVVADSPSRKVTAIGLIADADGKRVQLLRQVKGEYAPHS